MVVVAAVVLAPLKLQLVNDSYSHHCHCTCFLSNGDYPFWYAATKPAPDFLLWVGCSGRKMSVLIADVSLSFLVVLLGNPEVDLIYV